MRKFIQQVRSVALDIVEQIGADLRHIVSRHFEILYRSVYLRIPGTRVTAFIEWREVSVGRGMEKARGGVEFCLGRIQGVVCIEPKTAARDVA